MGDGGDILDLYTGQIQYSQLRKETCDLIHVEAAYWMEKTN